MDVKITNKRSSDLWEPVKAEILEHSEELTHYFNRIEEIEVVVSEDRHDHKPVFKVEMIVNCEHKHDIVVNGESDQDVTLAFHRAWHKAKRQLRKYKEKIQQH